MCKYCKNVKTGNDYKPLLITALNCGMLGRIDIDIYLSYESKLTINVDSSNSGLMSEQTKINYCPMCGERL